VAQLYPQHWVPFSSSPTIRRATVEVFDPASTRVNPLLCQCEETTWKIQDGRTDLKEMGCDVSTAFV
jgi:hypothetical protein